MRLYNINRPSFERRLASCSDSVFLETEGNRLLDIKHDMTARDIFFTMGIPKNGVNIFCKDPDDISIFLQYMVEANLCS